MSSTSSNATSRPWLIYAYPWMPYPRRLAIYLTEKRIPSSAVTIVHVSNPGEGDAVVPSQADLYPPRPTGSLPILSIPPSSADNGADWTHINQSMAIIEYLEEACAPGRELADVGARPLRIGKTALDRARLRAMLVVAEELTVCWNPVRMFGTNAGTMAYPECAKEMYKWVDRLVATMDGMLKAQGQDLAALADDEEAVSVGDIVLFQFLEFVVYCYGVDVTIGSGMEKKDVYGRPMKEEYPTIREWYQMFKKRESARRVGPGELAGEKFLEDMRHWHDGAR